MHFLYVENTMFIMANGGKKKNLNVKNDTELNYN